MRPNHISGSRYLPFGTLIFISSFLVVSLEATAQSPTPPRSGLAPPGTPYTVTNKDGSTTTTTNLPGGGTQVVTKDAKGNVTSSVDRTSTVSGGQWVTVNTGNVSASEQIDGQGVIRRLIKTDLVTKTKTILDYNDKGELVKATVSVVGDDGSEKPKEIYDPKGPDGSPERYNEAKHEFERIGLNDWDKLRKQLEATADEIKSIRNQYASEPEKDELAAVREEAAKHPMELVHDAGPLSLPKDPFETNYEQQKETEKQLDPCLIGSWRSISCEVIPLKEKGGGEGIVITINEDHSITIDYSAMTPMSGGNARNVWKGIASGHMWAAKGRAGTTSVEKAEAYLMTNGKRHPQGNYKDLGPAKITSYKCDETTLTVESVTHRIVYQRQKEAK